MKKTTLPLCDVLLLTPKVHRDERGAFVETYHREQFVSLGVTAHFIQDNQSCSKIAGTLRGLHYQLPPYSQTKVVRCVYGRVYDVVVDIRPSSPTYGNWVGVNLCAKVGQQIVVPKGCAHGFCTLTDGAIVAYKVDQPYAPAYERGIRWNDTSLAIDWPDHTPTLSEKDRALPSFIEAAKEFGGEHE
ncbi:dTDP-4-dehydrorhamnose 3,5-epimerase [Bacillus sp. FSL W7-1360]